MTTPLITLIAAVANNNVIGANNTLPWRLPADLKHFKQLTLGKPVIMGRKTYQSIGKPLPERTNIILTRDTSFTALGCVVCHSIEAALQTCSNAPEVMVIGGADIYHRFMPLAHRLQMTFINANIQGDAYFPTIDFKQWREANRETHTADAQNGYAYSFVSFEKI